MDWRRWTRNAQAVHAALQEAPDGSVVTKRRAAIYIPERYTEKKFAEIGAYTYILGFFALVIDDSVYAVSNAMAMMKVRPSVIATVKFDGESYLELQFEAGSVVIEDTLLIKTDTLVYYVFDEFVTKGRLPWFIDYRRDIGALFETSSYHAGMGFGSSQAIFDIIVSSIIRKAEDPTIYYRHAVQSVKDLDQVEPVTIPLRSVTYGATNTTTKLVGSYFSDGLDSALVNPSETVERIESILRM